MVWPLLTFLGLQEQPHEINQSQIRAIYETCCHTFSVTRRLTQHIILFFQNSSNYSFDPFVQDSRCQIQACFVHSLFAKLQTEDHQKDLQNLQSQTVERFDNLQNMLTIIGDLCTRVKRQPKADRNALFQNIQCEFLNFYREFQASKVWFGVDSVTQLITVSDFSMLLVYGILSSSRCVNVDLENDIFPTVEKWFFKKKVLKHFLLKTAKQHTIEFENKFVQSTLKGDLPSYPLSFIAFHNYCVENKVTLSFFIERDCSLHGSHVLQHFVRLQGIVESLGDLTNINHQEIPLQEISSSSQRCFLLFCFSHKEDSETGCDYSCWESKLWKVNLAQVIFSYACGHGVTNRFQTRDFQPLPGCSREDSSTFSISHIQFSLRPKMRKWERISSTPQTAHAAE